MQWLQIWDIADQFVTQKMVEPIPVIGSGDFEIKILEKFPVLRLNPDGKPHIRHLNIENWPIEKHEQKIIALQISQNSKLKIR